MQGSIQACTALLISLLRLKRSHPPKKFATAQPRTLAATANFDTADQVPSLAAAAATSDHLAPCHVMATNTLQATRQERAQVLLCDCMYCAPAREALPLDAWKGAAEQFAQADITGPK